MDEPLTVIDPDLKFRLRRKLKEINEQYNGKIRRKVCFRRQSANSACPQMASAAVMTTPRQDKL